MSTVANINTELAGLLENDPALQTLDSQSGCERQQRAQTPTCDELLKRATCHDVQALSWLLCQTFLYVVKVLSASGRVTRDAAHELAQKTCFHICLRITGKKGFAPYTFGAYLKFVRTYAYWRLVEDERKQRRYDSMDEAGEDYPALQTTDDLDGVDARLLVVQLLEHLSPVEQAVIIGRHVEGRSVEDMARDLPGMAREGVYKVTERALVKMRKELKRLLPRSGDNTGLRETEQARRFQSRTTHEQSKTHSGPRQKNRSRK